MCAGRYRRMESVRGHTRRQRAPAPAARPRPIRYGSRDAGQRVAGCEAVCALDCLILAHQHQQEEQCERDIGAGDGFHDQQQERGIRQRRRTQRLLPTALRHQTSAPASGPPCRKQTTPAACQEPARRCRYPGSSGSESQAHSVRLPRRASSSGQTGWRTAALAGPGSGTRASPVMKFCSRVCIDSRPWRCQVVKPHPTSRATMTTPRMKQQRVESLFSAGLPA